LPDRHVEARRAVRRIVAPHDATHNAKIIITIPLDGQSRTHAVARRALATLSPWMECGTLRAGWCLAMTGVSAVRAREVHVRRRTAIAGLNCEPLCPFGKRA
jgi:hypothetical protein